MPFARPFTLALAFALTAAVAGCSKDKVGGKCTPGQDACLDATSGLFCGADSKFQAMSCRGPQGCTKPGGTAVCDNSAALEKDGCSEKGDISCSVDKKAALECRDGTFAVAETCKGSKGCDIKDNKLTCDNDVADVGDPCQFDNDYACTSDKVFVVKCIEKKMVQLNSCRGAKGCRVVALPEEKKIEFLCDDSVAKEADACDEEGEHACSMDKKALLACKDKKFTSHKACDGPDGCTYDEKGEKFNCTTLALAKAVAPAAAPAGAKTAAPKTPKKK